MTATVMWDQDGIKARWTEGFNEFAGQPPDEEWESWSHYKSWGWSTPKFLAELQRFGDEGHFRNLQPHHDALLTFRVLAGFPEIRQVVVTDKPTGRSFQDAVDWLEDHGLVPFDVIRSADKTEFLQHARPGDKLYGLDDKPENIEALLKAGVEAYLRDQPWNRHVDLPRVSDALEFGLIVLDGIGVSKWS